MSKVRVVMDNRGMQELLTSPEVAGFLKSRMERVAAGVPGGVVVTDTSPGLTASPRARARAAYPPSMSVGHAIREEAKYGRLAQAFARAGGS